MNPILNSFQQVVNDYNIERELIDCFLDSMAMDLSKSEHNLQSYEKYILGSAEVVGLMCLRVFTERDEKLYQIFIYLFYTINLLYTLLSHAAIMNAQTYLNKADIII